MAVVPAIENTELLDDSRMIGVSRVMEDEVEVAREANFPGASILVETAIGAGRTMHRGSGRGERMAFDVTLRALPAWRTSVLSRKLAT